MQLKNNMKNNKTKDNKITEELIEKQIDDSLPRQRKILCRMFLRTKEGQTAWKDVTGSKQKETKKYSGWGFFWLCALIWGVMGILYSKLNPVSSNAWIKKVIDYSFLSAYSQPIIILILIACIEFVFIYSLLRKSGKLIKEIKAMDKTSSKILAVISEKVWACFGGFFMLAFLFMAFFMFLLPFPSIIPGLVSVELWMRSHPLELLVTLVSVTGFILLNYWIFRLLSDNIKYKTETKSKRKKDKSSQEEPTQEELEESDKIIEALQSNPNIEVIDKEVKVK